jgi:hypothetical protein
MITLRIVLPVLALLAAGLVGLPQPMVLAQAANPATAATRSVTGSHQDSKAAQGQNPAVAGTADGGSAPGLANTNWLTVFDERFADNPTPSQRLKIMPVFVPGTGGSTAYDEMRHAYSLAGHISLVRPVRAGPHVDLELALRFIPAETNAPPTVETDFLFVLFDRSAAGIQVLRSSQADAPTSVRFVHQKAGETRELVLRELQLPSGSLDGGWRLTYRHGLLTLVHGTNTVGSADIDQLGVPVAGVTWIQKGGQVACERMTLQGEPLRELSATDQETLQRAARLNDEARALLRDQKPDEALARMEESSALFVEVHGEHHYDAANSFANLASIIEATGNRERAATLWAKALAIHEQSLGLIHPHTTLTRFNLGKNFFDRGEMAKARELWTRCRDDWRAVLGADYSMVKSLDTILPRL